MSYTRINPALTTGSATAAQTDVRTGYCQFSKYGRIVAAAANFSDATPDNGGKILEGYPPPANRVPIAVVCGTAARRVYLSTNGELIWDGAGDAGWANASFSYLSAT